MEKAKAFSLYQSLKEANAEDFVNIPDRWIQQESNLKVSIAHCKKALNETAYYDSTMLSETQDRLFQNTWAYEKL